jgi:hypothetical protein
MASSLNSDNGVVSGSAGVKTTADTSGVLALQSNGSTGLTLDTSLNVGIGTTSPTTKLDVNGTITALSVTSANTFGFKNRLINGNMVIDQRNAGALITLTTTASYPVDRWAAFEESDGVMTAQRVADAPAGFLNSIKFTTTTADPSLTGAERVYALQGIEGLNMIDLAWGTASAKTVTVSFWVKSSLTGTFGGSLRGNLNYPFSYTISSANTWEQKSVTIAGPTTGTWPTDTSLFVYVTFGMGIGPSLSGGGGAWTASNFIAPSGAVAVISTLNATFQVTGVQFEVGSTATSFDVRDYGRELILCQRYCTTINDATTSGYIQGYGGGCRGVTYIGVTIPLPTVMRSTPSLSNVGGTVRLTVGGTAVDSASSSMTIGGVTPTIGYSANSGNLALTYIGGPVTGLSGITNNVCVTFFTNGDGKLFAFSEI